MQSTAIKAEKQQWSRKLSVTEDTKTSVQWMNSVRPRTGKNEKKKHHSR